jgi:hypothetical protein
MKTLLTAAVIAVALSSSAWAGKPLSDKQMDWVTAGDASALAFAFGAFTSTSTFTSVVPSGGWFQFNSSSFSSSSSP